jgi:hypothetical protein
VLRRRRRVRVLRRLRAGVRRRGGVWRAAIAARRSRLLRGHERGRVGVGPGRVCAGAGAAVRVRRRRRARGGAAAQRRQPQVGRSLQGPCLSHSLHRGCATSHQEQTAQAGLLPRVPTSRSTGAPARGLRERQARAPHDRAPSVRDRATAAPGAPAAAARLRACGARPAPAGRPGRHARARRRRRRRRRRAARACPHAIAASAAAGRTPGPPTAAHEDAALSSLMSVSQPQRWHTWAGLPNAHAQARLRGPRSPRQCCHPARKAITYSLPWSRDSLPGCRGDSRTHAGTRFYHAAPQHRAAARAPGGQRASGTWPSSSRGT